jgi:hypothetical protein
MGWDGGGVFGVGTRNLCVLRFLVLLQLCDLYIP